MKPSDFSQTIKSIKSGFRVLPTLKLWRAGKAGMILLIKFKRPKFFIWLFLLLIFIFGIGFLFASAYKPEPTHSLLAKKSGEIFKQYYGNLNDEEISWLVEGAKNEDTPPRWINHFYDPTTDQGWTGERMGVLPSDIVQAIASIGLSQESAVSAPNWARNQELQTMYKRYQGNRTFEKAIYDYVNGDKKEAYKSLGHILHLIEDMTVPAHTRQDTHLDAVGDPGEPYEKWVAENNDISFLNNLNPKQENFFCQNLDDCFVKIAKYSNENFFSEGTILDKEYGVNFDVDYIKSGKDYYAFKKNNLDYYLYKCEKDKNGNFINFTVGDDKINSSYWRLLSKQAVLSGVEVIRIFQEEVAKAQKDKSLLKTPPPESSIFLRLTTGLGGLIGNLKPWPIFSPYGEFVLIKDGAEYLWQESGEIAGSILSWISGQAKYLYAGPSKTAQKDNGFITADLIRIPDISPAGNGSAGQNLPVQEQPPVASSASPQKIAIEKFIKTISADESKLIAVSEIKEEILKPKAPSEIKEEKFSPQAPQIQPQSQSSAQQLSQGTGGWPDEEGSEEEMPTSTQPVATSTPQTLPSVSIFLSDYNIASRRFSINWQSTSSDISTYDVDTKSSLQDWQNWEIATTSTSKIFEPTQDETIYYFRARATNSHGTSSDWQEIEAPINFYPIAINEIAWAGTEASSQDEWVEFFNRTPLDIDMSGWRLISSDNKPNIVFSTSTKFSAFIYGNSFYLIERTNGSTTSEKEDWVGSFGSGSGMGLGNNPNCEILSLYDSYENLIDRTVCLVNGNWPAGAASPNYQSMERVNPYLSADIPGNWQSNSTTTRNGLDSKGQPINGTPKAQNSVFDLDFFYLYPATSTAAASTKLEWTKSYLENFKEYKIARDFDATFSNQNIVSIVTTTNFIDNSLEPRSEYFYKILACDNSDYCAESNSISVKTKEYEIIWSVPQIVSENSTSSIEFMPDMALGGDNLPAAAWFKYQDNSNRHMCFSKKNQDNSWSRAEKTPKEYYPSFYPRILSRGNDFEILFTGEFADEGGEPYDVLSWRSSSGAWQKPQNIAENKFGMIPWGAIDKLSVTHIVWMGESNISSTTAVFYRALGPDGLFLGPPEEINSSQNGVLPKIAVDSQNKLYVIWYYWPPGSSKLEKILYSVNLQDGAGWSEPKEVSAIKKPAPLPEPARIKIDVNDQVFVSWDQDDGIHVVKFDEATTTLNSILTIAGKKVKSPAIAFDNANNPYLFFVGSWNSGSGIYFSAFKDGHWENAKTVFEFDYQTDRPAVAIDSNNLAHLVWEGGLDEGLLIYSYNSRVYYSFAKIE